VEHFGQYAIRGFYSSYAAYCYLFLEYVQIAYDALFQARNCTTATSRNLGKWSPSFVETLIMINPFLLAFNYLRNLFISLGLPLYFCLKFPLAIMEEI
jgi:hypothetical protein